MRPITSGTDASRCLIKVLAHTAVRRAHVADSDTRDIDFESHLLQVREGRGGTSRTVRIAEELASDLRHLIGHRKSGPVFLSQKRGGSRRSGRSIGSWRRSFNGPTSSVGWMGNSLSSFRISDDAPLCVPRLGLCYLWCRFCYVG